MFEPMYSRYIFVISALIVVTMMDVLYYSKPKTNKKLKHRMYSYLIMINTLVLIAEILIMIAFWINMDSTTCIILFRLRDIVLICYFIFILFYYYTAVNNIEYNSLKEFIINEKLIRPHLIFTAIVIIIHIFLPYNKMTKETFSYAYSGLAFYLIIIYCILTTFETLYLTVFKNKNGIKFNDKLSLIWLFFLMIVLLVLQVIFSGANIMALISSIYILGLYFIFENPDLELVEEIDTLTTDIEKASQSKIDFLSNMSKEMILPMNNIIILSEDILTTSNISDKKILDDFKQIEISSKNFLEIVDNTLNISTIESDKETLNEKNYSLSELLNHITSIAKEKMLGKNIELITNIDNSIPNNLNGDYDKLYQVLINIISNSIKYTEIGKITITLTQEIKSSKIILRFKISDTGYGIKKEDYNKIFQKYSRLEEAVSNEIEGTGLGLAIVKQYVDLMEGKIWFDSVYGAGTNFYLEIPQNITNMANTLNDFKLSEIEEEKLSILDCSKYKILIVEDDNLNLRVNKRLFERYKFNIETCSSGKDCIYKYKNGEKYDMIFIDHEMPEMTGIEVMKIIRKLKDYEAPPLVALTANSFADSKEMYIKEGFDEYISKPIDVIELNSLVNKYFKK